MPRRRVPSRPQGPKAKASRQRKQNPLWTSKRANRGGCPTGKVRFRSEDEAKSAMSGVKEQAARGVSKRRENRIYPCHVCSGWHLTSAPEIAPPLGPR